ncbi:MAG: hypothetical protein IJJ33_08640 [Victivallales bacterium]|nr:hypothetical protein [Victivallales bacterium]
MISFQVSPEWLPRLKASNLDSFESLMRFQGGECLSKHPRGKTYRHVLPCGQVVFIKQDFYTKKMVVLRDWLHLHSAQPNTVKERLRMAMASRHGFRVAEVIAYGQVRCCGVPSRAVMVTLPVPGRSLEDFLKDNPPAEQGRKAIANALSALRRLQDEGLDWKIDCKPEHFFVADDLSVSLVDVERLADRKAPLAESVRRMQEQRFHSLLPEGWRDR